MKRTNDPSRNRPCLGVGLDAFSLLFTAQPRHSDISAHFFPAASSFGFFSPFLTLWAFFPVYIFALFGLFIFFIGGAIPASQGARYEFLCFSWLGLEYDMSSFLSIAYVSV